MGEHYPLPWRTGEQDNGRADWIFAEGQVIADCEFISNEEINLANAAFIVKAVNSHDALVTALQFYADRDRYDGPNQRLIGNDPHTPKDQGYLQDVTRDGGDIAREALAKASTS